MDELNFNDIKEIVEKSPELQKTLEGPTKWVGDVGFDECVAHLSKKKGITNANKLCGYLKGKAREKGQLKKEHMGSIERKAKNRKFTKSELVDYLKSTLKYGQSMADEFADLIFKARTKGAKDIKKRN